MNRNEGRCAGEEPRSCGEPLRETQRERRGPGPGMSCESFPGLCRESRDLEHLVLPKHVLAAENRAEPSDPTLHLTCRYKGEKGNGMKSDFKGCKGRS